MSDAWGRLGENSGPGGLGTVGISVDRSAHIVRNPVAGFGKDEYVGKRWRTRRAYPRHYLPRAKGIVPPIHKPTVPIITTIIVFLPERVS
jgi:hypothetical protein